MNQADQLTEINTISNKTLWQILKPTETLQLHRVYQECSCMWLSDAVEGKAKENCWMVIFRTLLNLFLQCFHLIGFCVYSEKLMTHSAWITLNSYMIYQYSYTPWLLSLTAEPWLRVFYFILLVLPVMMSML